MSTRANILVKDEDTTQWFYRHSDGYPSVTAQSLQQFIQMLVNDEIRNNVSQGSPWLIVLGHREYNEMNLDMYKWKVGAYEITDRQHYDIEWLYIIDMNKKTVKVSKLYPKKSKTMSYKKFLAYDAKQLENELSEEKKEEVTI
jgi:hypothetical protein